MSTTEKSDDQDAVDARANKAMRLLVEMFSGPTKPNRGRDLFGRRRYDLVRLEDGTITFVRNAFDAEMDQMFTEILDEPFGPEPAEDVEYRAEGSR